MAFSGSYRKVFYDLRPAKQVERRMLIDAFQLLAQGGFPIAEYQYTGFGSIYFVDFVLFHKYLGIDRLLSLEYDADAGRRAQFNKPYRGIELRLDSAANAIPRLSRDLKHILWLDYDFGLEQVVLADTISSSYQLSPGSILLVTVDSEPPEADGGTTSSDFSYATYRSVAGDFWNPDWTAADFGASSLPAVCRDIFVRAIANGLSTRVDVTFEPLFSFVYQDGHTMFTFGGMISSETERRLLSGCGLGRAPYLRRRIDSDPYHIKIPRLTRRERAYLDTRMPLKNSRSFRRIGLSEDDVAAYAAVYRFFPSYIESLF